MRGITVTDLDGLDKLRAPDQNKTGTQGFKMMGVLSQLRHVYGGTVDPVTIAKRRAANKVARKSRRINRRK